MDMAGVPKHSLCPDMGHLAQRFPQEADVFFHFCAERHVLELYPANSHAAEFPLEGNSRNVVAGNGRNQAARAQVVSIRMDKMLNIVERSVT